MSGMEKETRPEPKPTCPYCGANPCPVGINVANFGGGALAGIFICGVCTKILSVAPLPAIVPPAEPERPRIVIPQ